ncbi:MAG: tetratricopeptide repeat protein [Candidatus Brocadiales bacterium]
MDSRYIIKKLFVLTIIALTLLLNPPQADNPVNANTTLADTTSESNQSPTNEARDWINKGNALVKGYRYAEAIECFEKAIQISQQVEDESNEAEAWLEKGHTLDKLYKREEAITCFNKIIDKNPENEKALFFKGLTLFRLDRHEDAIECFDKIIDINVRFKTSSLYVKVAVLAKSGEQEEAKGFFDASNHKAKGQGNKWVLFSKGFALFHLGMYEKHENDKIDYFAVAIECFDKALKAINVSEDQEFVVRAHYSKGDVFTKMKKYKDAIDCYEDAIEINSRCAKAMCGMGVALCKSHKHKEAIDCYKKAIAINPYFAEALCNMGVALYHRNKYKEAINCYEKAIEIYPEYAEAWYNKGASLLKIGHEEEASEAFKKAHRKNPEKHKYLTGWINSICEEGKLDEGLKKCENGIGRFKEDNDALKDLFYQKGVILNKQGKTEDALIAFKESKNLSNKEAAEAISRIIKAKAGWWDWWFYSIRNGRPIVGGLLLAILITMLIIPLIMISPYRHKILSVSLEDFSKIWKIWVACMLILLFALFHRNIKGIRTPYGEVEMPRFETKVDFDMLSLDVSPQS